jgi:hypothetical protein
MLDPDWLRVGTDIVGGATPPKFNFTFSLTGDVTPLPATLPLFATGLGARSARLAQEAEGGAVG